MKRIVVSGPESSGKTTLATFIARSFDIPLVPEFARFYLSDPVYRYDLTDLVLMAQGQIGLSGDATPDRFVIHDTWMLEFRVWAEYRFGRVPVFIEEMLVRQPPHLYILCAPDLPWESDPLRENPHDRDVLFSSYHSAMIASGVPFIVASGAGPEREQSVIEHALLRSVLSPE